MFDADTNEDAIAAFVDAVRQSREGREDLVAILAEAHPLYAGRSTNETARIRGYVLAAFEHTGLPHTALPYVLEELESGREPYLVAAAAKAVRGLPGPTADVVPYLFRAIDNIRSRDDALTFDVYRPRWPLASHTTALTEIVRTFAWLGAAAAGTVARLEALSGHDGREFSAPVREAMRQAIDRIQTGGAQEATDCCTWLPALVSAVRHDGDSRRRRRATVPDVVLEDQEGRRTSFDRWFTGKPCVIVFFYTRCDNPNKCSLTIAQLARVQGAIRARGLSGRIRTAAITYDPEFDSAARLKSYGVNRGLTLTDDDRMFRTACGFEDVRRYFGLGMNRGPATVNRHRIELFVVDARGRIAVALTRLQWQVETVVDEAVLVLNAARSPSTSSARVGHRSSWPTRASLANGFSAALASGLVALLPKCPLCWAAYTSALGLSGLPLLPYAPWARPVLVALIVLHLVAVSTRARRWRGRWRLTSLVLSAAGALASVLGMQFDLRAAMLCAAVLMAAGSLLNSLPPRPAIGAIRSGSGAL